MPATIWAVDAKNCINIWRHCVILEISKNYWEDLYEKLDEFLLKGENKKYYNKVETSMKCQLYNETQDIMEHNKIKSQNTEVST